MPTKAGNKVYLLILINFLAHGSGYARIRIQDKPNNADPCKATTLSTRQRGYLPGGYKEMSSISADQ